MSALAFFDEARRYKRELTGEPLISLTDEDVVLLNAATVSRWKPAESSQDAHTAPIADSQPIRPTSPETRTDGLLTARVAMELIGHEAIVQEAYKDSVAVWTWGIGVTNASGHSVYPRYKDNPQSIARCLEVFVWLLRERYLPAVERAFKGRHLTEAQLAAALSFHYNTGAIERANWVKCWLRGDLAGSEKSFMEWRKPREIIPRRTRERDLFFDGRWSSDGKATVIPVKKPSYTPDWAKAKRVDISSTLGMLLS